MISTRRVRTSCSVRSVSRSGRDRPLTMLTASRAWSSMCRIGTVSSCLDIQLLRLGEHLVAEVLARRVGGVQVDAAPQDRGQLILHPEEGEPGRLTRFELDEDVHVALGREIVAQERAEEGQAADVVATAEVSDPLVWDLDAGAAGRHGAKTAFMSRPGGMLNSTTRS